ncbi:Crp/Fnr family transcriptional regulator [Novosphingobium jiangmenense]|uniref:Crp/Fnr family transcriptional regulator n=1 Tax=Novosphingobium jiangmenense TaxID=2791981 RepID=A0ABS0HJ00_9SPHN|nr:Crp/Fnr family transcriptional regulator [Novosphingobium jiangmenense]MBF9152232.1 Crp/Fnr family transcriptional regulator [Novosphingobium jiangmenense]
MASATNPVSHDLTVLFGRHFACAADVAAQMASAARDNTYSPRAVILGLGARNEQVHVMLSGRARARAISLEGRQAVLEEYQAGDMFGEQALLGQHDLELEIIAVDAVRAAAMMAHVMMTLMATHPAVAVAVSRQLIARLAAQNARLAGNTTLSATGRIHAEILRMGRESGDLCISPAPVLSQLALRVQSTRETVSRTIAALQRRGIIERDEHSLRIVAEHRLEELIY